MKILLSYSRLHFDPSKNPKEQKYWGSSASILARTLIDILTKIGNVTYIDSSEYEKVKGIEFDLFVGITNNFYKIWQSAKIKKSIYFAVNMHPRERNWILLKYLIKERLSPKALAGWDLVNFIEAEKGIRVADYILCMGNIATYNSYIKYGIPKSKIKVLNYGIPERKEIKKKSPKKSFGVKKFVYPTSEVGLRKGFDIIFSIFTDPKIRKLPFHLDIIGLPTNKYYEQKLKELIKKLGKKVTYHGWIDSCNEKYSETIKNNHFIIFPSLEEGQAGTVVDAIRFGTIPIISQNSGIDFSPLGNLELKSKSNRNKEKVLKSLNLSDEQIEDLKNKTLEYYAQYHENFKENLETSIKDCIENNLYPKISIVLPIYNKEKTIMPLIKLLHLACYEYQNIEVHIIFDGCEDKTEKRVRYFYKNIRSYFVTFETTYNIFETKTNNIGLKKATGKYCVIIQDDIYIFDKNIFFEAVNFLNKNSQVAILGCLSGVNYYPRGTKLVGPGQIAMDKNEVYWRQDERTDRQLKKRIFEVDACMRGPLIIQKSFLEKYGYLDETYAPFYMDDMDICFRARQLGFKVYCLLGDVLNTSLTVTKYDGKKAKFWIAVIARNSDRFYSRWQPTKIKDYLWLNRTKIINTPLERLLCCTRKVFIQRMNRDYFMRLACALYKQIIHK